MITSPPARILTKVSNAASISRSLLAWRTWSCSPRARAAACRAREKGSAILGLVGLMSRAMLVALGTTSCSSSSRFGPTSTFKLVTPARLPPGRFRLATSPSATGSTAAENTIGIVVVALFAASADVMPAAAITATGRRTNSAASAGKRSLWPSAQRYSIATFRLSTKPTSLRPWRNAATLGAYPPDVSLLRNPITGMAGCCARAASGHAAAPPKSVMNWRRSPASVSRASDRKDSTARRGQAPAALRHFDPAHVAFGSLATETIGAGDRSISAVPQKRTWRLESSPSSAGLSLLGNYLSAIGYHLPGKKKSD